MDPAFFGIGPVPAVQKALKKSGMTVDDIDQTELNEAFAVQALHCIRELELNMETTNVNGSGISLGHPIGATGAIQTVKLMDEMDAPRRRGRDGDDVRRRRDGCGDYFREGELGNFPLDQIPF